MIEVNKPEDTTPNVRCYKCKAEFYVHPQANILSPYVTNCELHKPECTHHWNDDGLHPRHCIKCKLSYDGGINDNQ